VDRCVGRLVTRARRVVAARTVTVDARRAVADVQVRSPRVLRQVARTRRALVTFLASDGARRAARAQAVLAPRPAGRRRPTASSGRPRR